MKWRFSSSEVLSDTDRMVRVGENNTEVTIQPLLTPPGGNCPQQETAVQNVPASTKAEGHQCNTVATHLTRYPEAAKQPEKLVTLARERKVMTKVAGYYINSSNHSPISSP